MTKPFQIPSTATDNEADCYNESHKNAEHHYSDNDGVCKRYITAAVNWSFHDISGTTRVKACKYDITHK